MNFELNDDEYETLKDIFNDWGSDCPSVDTNKFQALGEKLGILEPIPEPTEEELKRREEFRNSDAYKQITELMKSSNHFLENMAKDLINRKPLEILYGQLKINPNIKIRLPNDYLVEK